MHREETVTRDVNEHYRALQIRRRFSDPVRTRCHSEDTCHARLSATEIERDSIPSPKQQGRFWPAGCFMPGGDGTPDIDSASGGSVTTHA